MKAGIGRSGCDRCKSLQAGADAQVRFDSDQRKHDQQTPRSIEQRFEEIERE